MKIELEELEVAGAKDDLAAEKAADETTATCGAQEALAQAIPSPSATRLRRSKPASYDRVREVRATSAAQPAS